MTELRIDLHCHSTASDGRLTPVQLVERAAQLGLKALALTDHDTVSGIGTFMEAGRKYGVETIAGVEISADYPHGTLHITGLFIDPQSQALRAFLKKLSEGRRIRNPQIIQKLNALGIDITLEEAEQNAGAEGASAHEKTVGRPHIAAVLIQKGCVKTKQEAFDKYLGKGGLAYVSRFSASPEESIDQIHSAGGIAILAHPAQLRAADAADLERIIARLKQQRLDGIEVWSAGNSSEQSVLFAHMAAKYGLLPAGGSDFHGEAGPGIRVELGYGINKSLCIPYAVLENIKSRKHLGTFAPR